MAIADNYAVLSSAVRLANSGKLSYQTRLQLIVNHIARSFSFVSAAAYLVDEERRHLTLKINDLAGAVPVNCLIPLGEGVAGRCAASREPVALDVRDAHYDEWHKGGEKEYFALPLMDDGRLYGVLSLGIGEHYDLSAAGRTTLNDLAAVLSGVVINYVVSQWTDRRTLLMGRIADLVKVLNRSLHPDVLVPQVLLACHRATDSCCTVLRLFPNDDGIPDGIFHKVTARYRSRLNDLLGIEESSHERVIASGFPLLTTDLVAEEDLPPSYVCVPLLFESRLMGTLTFFGKAGEARPAGNYNEEERELFFNLATLMANALQSGANYRKMEIFAEKNRNKVKELLLLNRVSTIMLSTIRLNELISLVLTSLTAPPTTIFDRAMLFLINEKGGYMQGMLGVTRETAGDGVIFHEDDEQCPWCLPGGVERELARQMSSEFSREVRDSRLPLDANLNLCSRAVRDRKVIHVPDVTCVEVLDREFVARFGIAALAAAPLIAKEQVIGIIIVDNSPSGRPITDDNLRFLQLFTNQAGMAIENSILYNRLEDANRELSETHERLIQGERLAAIGEMAASIAHEVKGPLVSIGGFARRISKKAKPESDEWQCADTITREVMRLENLLTDILSYSRKTTICYTDCNVVDIVEESLALVSHSLRENRIRVRTHFEQGLPPFLGDCQQLKQVFLNLFINAQEAMKGGGEIAVSVRTADLDGVPAVAVQVCDSGKGIPAEIISTIFNPFFTTKATGTGLGLPIVHRIVTNHLGRIEVGNRSEGGAVFTVTLPFHP